MTRAIVLAVGTTLLALLTGAFGLFLVQRERARHRERELQTELIHLARLNTMGQTAAMLAHEINQPLTAAANYLAAAQAISESFDPPRFAKATEVLHRAGAQLERAGDIVRRLRNFVER
jgi:two-component system, LuxR family, sensor kinase FixL